MATSGNPVQPPLQRTWPPPPFSGPAVCQMKELGGKRDSLSNGFFSLKLTHKSDTTEAGDRILNKFSICLFLSFFMTFSQFGKRYFYCVVDSFYNAGRKIIANAEVKIEPCAQLIINKFLWGSLSDILVNPFNVFLKFCHWWWEGEGGFLICCNL